MLRRFRQVDVFATGPLSGNPLAVVVDGGDLTDDEMLRFANWTNLSETTFLLPPRHDEADYWVRIFTPSQELPFAGHPTLGSCQVWLDVGGRTKQPDVVVQECGVGLVSIVSDGRHLAFAAPDLIRSGPVDDELRARIENALGTEILDMAWADNGPGWIAVLLPTADDVLALDPDWGGDTDLKIGVVGRATPGLGYDVEVRAFYPGPNGMSEDPVTGSLNASLAQWLMAGDPTITSYTARQGTRLGRAGRVLLQRDDDGVIWVGGAVTTAVIGHVDL